MDMTRTIELTQGKVALVDDRDFEYLNQWKWQAMQNSGTWYAVRTIYSPCKKSIKMHRLITGAPDGMLVDHFNMDGLDNRRANLRVCTKAENMCNRGKQANNTTGFKGVFRSKDRYLVQITVDGRIKSIGRYATPEEAARVYDQAALKYHGRFARLNFPRES
jgi:hypothetical protein